MADHEIYNMPRRQFIGCLAGGGAALALGGLLPSAAEAAAVATPHPHAGQWDERWLRRIDGRHRQVFDAVSVGDEMLIFGVNYIDTNKLAYDLADNDITTVIVLRHMAIPMAFSDDIWRRYKLGEMLKVTDPRTGKYAARNIFIKRRPGEMKFPDAAVDLLQQRGVIFTCCSVAVTVASGMTAARAGVSKETAKQEWIEGLLEGITLVPSGVLAVNRAQEKGCTYCYAG
ncbi:MAG TPA: twin-arginine translocation signal domain-containing protein [Gammaproteobacteria bacterium]|nr:twin-arginine translocation signal domain-containing protein [Gammaproteobacteria bacterium]